MAHNLWNICLLIDISEAHSMCKEISLKCDSVHDPIKCIEFVLVKIVVWTIHLESIN